MKTKKSGIFLDEKTKKYYVSTTFKTKDNFSIKKCKRGFETLKAAEIWKVNTKQEIESKSYANLTASKSGIALAIDDYITYKSNNTKPSTLNQIKCSLNKTFKDYLLDNNYLLSDFNIKDLNNIYSSICTADTKAQSKNNDISTVINFIEYLDLMELIDASISRKAKLIFKKFEVTDLKEKDIFENDEFEKLLSVLSDDDWFKLLYEILYYTGARISEVLALTWNDIDLVNNEISFNKHVIFESKFIKNNIACNKSSFVMTGTKTQNKVVSIFGLLIEELNRFKNLDDEEFIFYNKTGFSKINIWFKLKEHLKNAGINKNITIHSFRHTHTTMLYDLGLDGKYIAERLGHSNENTSKTIYEHITESRKKKNDEILKNKFVV